jgi:hypothetical protein
LPLGDLQDTDLKADGSYATKCKPIPSLPPLSSPKITLSLDGLTLHLTDATGFDRVYPIGPGKINHNKGETTYDRSLTAYPVLRTKSNQFSIKTKDVDPCAIWWTDKATGARAPVFAGLPFMSWYGSYGIHGPVDNYSAPNGGRLQRGYVSHGCVRMEAADVAEVWGYVRKTPVVPVWVQEDIERRADGTAVDIPQRWLLSECKVDADCNYSGGICLPNKSTGRGYCTVRCSGSCSYDKWGYPVSFCVADPQTPGQGICTLKSSDHNDSCRRYDGFRTVSSVPRFPSATAKASVCLPK